jgi:hypothetical protein
VVNYNYCEFATRDPNSDAIIPCAATFFADDAALMSQIDYNDPWYVGLNYLGLPMLSRGIVPANIIVAWPMIKWTGQRVPKTKHNHLQILLPSLIHF